MIAYICFEHSETIEKHLKFIVHENIHLIFVTVVANNVVLTLKVL